MIEARNSIHSLLETVQEQQEQFTNIASLCDTDAAIPVAFTKDNRVHIGPKMEMRLVVLGLDGAGKTSILFKMKQDEFVSPITTIGKYIPNLRFFIKLRWTSVGDPGEGPGGPFHILFRQNWGPKVRKECVWDRPPLPPYLRIWMTASPSYLKVWIHRWTLLVLLKVYAFNSFKLHFKIMRIFFFFPSGFNVETVEHRSLKFTLWDVGGLQKLRPLWRHYYLNTQG